MPTTMKLIAKTTLGSAAATVTFSDIPQTYTDLYFLISARSTFSGGTAYRSFYVKPNNATTNLSTRIIYGSGTTVGSETDTTGIYPNVSAAGSTSNTFGSVEIYIPNYAGSTNKSISATWAAETNAASGNILGATAGLWSSTSAITSMVFDAATTVGTTFTADSSFFLYGITKA